MNALNRTVVAPLSSAIIAVLLAGIVVVGVDRVERKLRIGEARLEAQGVVEVAVNGEPYVQASRGRVILNRDDRVRVVEGRAILELPRSATAELRAGSEVRIADGNDAALVLEAGDLLVEAPRDTVEVDGGTALVSVAGAAKLRRAASLVAGVYDGNVIFQKDLQRLAVPRYRSAAAAGTGLLPDSPSPLDLRPTDEWDRRMLPHVLDLDTQLQAMGRGFEAQLPSDQPTGPELYRVVVPQLADAPLTPGLLAGRAPGENIIGLVLVALDQGEFVDRVQRVFGFRGEGASWGLVAADRNLNPVPVLGSLESAMGALASSGPDNPIPGLYNQLGAITGGERGDATTTGGEVAAPAAPPAPSGQGSPSGSNPPPSGGSTPPSSPPPPVPPPSTPPPKRVDVPPTGTGLDPVLEPIVNPLENLLSGVLDGLLGTPTASEPPYVPPGGTTTTTAPAPAGGGLLGGLTGTVGGLLGG